MSDGYFDLVVPAQQGWMGLDADSSVDKSERTSLLMQAVEVTEEKDLGHLNYESQKLSEPMNIFTWKSSQTVLAPRGGYGSWSNCVPAYHQGLNQYLPVENEALAKSDADYEPLTLTAVRNYGIEFPKNVLAFVSSTTEHGNHKPIAIAGGGPLVAHWRGQTPPRFSRHVYDIDARGRLDANRHAGLHTIFKVQRYGIGGRGSVVGPAIQLFSIALTGNASPDSTGFLRVTFGSEDALMSNMMSGPLTTSFAAKHLLGPTPDGDIIAGALSTNAFFRGSKMPFTAPIRFEELPYPSVLNGEIPYEVHKYYDDAFMHVFVGGMKNGMWRDFVKLPIGETPECEPTKDTGVFDANGNPARTFMDSAVFFAGGKKLISTGTYYQQRVRTQFGRKQP